MPERAPTPYTRASPESASTAPQIRFEVTNESNGKLLADMVQQLKEAGDVTARKFVIASWNRQRETEQASKQGSYVAPVVGAAKS